MGKLSVMNRLPNNPDLIFEAVRDHLDREHNKRWRIKSRPLIGFLKTT